MNFNLKGYGIHLIKSSIFSTTRSTHRIHQNIIFIISNYQTSYSKNISSYDIMSNRLSKKLQIKYLVAWWHLLSNKFFEGPCHRDERLKGDVPYSMESHISGRCPNSMEAWVGPSTFAHKKVSIKRTTFRPYTISLKWLCFLV